MSFPFLPRVRQHGCGDPGHEIPFACTFDGAQALSRTPAVNGSRQTWTASFWAKLTKPGANDLVLSAGDATVEAGVHLQSDRMYLRQSTSGGGVIAEKSPAALTRDPAGWGHFHFAVETGHATESERFRLYQNGARITSFASSVAVAAALLTYIGTMYPHWIGRSCAGAEQFLHAILADFHFLDGIAADPTAFGYVNRYNVWVPKKYTGAYGAQGWHLDFADPLNLGKDVSGNGNHFAASGLTATNQVTDTPTHGFATLNALQPIAGQVLSFGNLKNTISNSAGIVRQSTLSMTSGLWYAEVTCIGSGGGGGSNNFNTQSVGLQRADKIGTSFFAAGVAYVGGSKRIDGATTAYGTAWQSPGVPYVIGIRADLDANTAEFFLDGVSQGVVALPTSGAVWTFAGVWESSTGTGSQTWNFGQRAFAHPENQGLAKTLSIPSLPCPPVKSPESYFTVRLASNTEGVADLPWNPLATKTLVLSKTRALASDWRANDTLRPGRPWACNTTGTDFTESGLSFTSTGYTIGAAWAGAGARVDYCFRASRAAGFDMLLVNHVNGVADVVPHAVGGAIDYAWVVPVGVGGTRRVFHRSLGAGQYLQLNGGALVATDAGWFASSPVDLTLGASLPTGQYALYLWRAVPGFSAFGAYGGNSLADGAFFPTDFSPRLAFIKTSQAVNPHYALDVDRAAANPITAELQLGTNGVENTITIDAVDFVSNGLKQRAATSENNTSGNTLITVAAWAAVPGKFARAR